MKKQKQENNVILIEGMNGEKSEIVVKLVSRIGE